MPTIVVALRNPYDLRGLPGNVSAIAAYAYNRPAMDAVLKALRGDIALSGRLPVAL